MPPASTATNAHASRHRVLILGAGKIGSAIARYLHRCGDYAVTLGDVDPVALSRVKDALGGGGGSGSISTVSLDVSDPASLVKAMAPIGSGGSVISACSFAVNPGIAKACMAAGCSYFDLTEDVATTRAVKAVSAEARDGQIFMPQCGLAPGFIQIAAHELTKEFEKLDEVRMRVGALPIYPSNALKYNLTWSTDGLINEYCNPCEAIYEGRRTDLLPLEGYEMFSLDGVAYEAFNTSGGLGTLCDTLEGKCRTLDYKTVRYAGHRDLVHFLVSSLRLCDRRAILKDILENAIPITLQDVVLTFTTVTGWKEGRLTQVTDARKIYNGSPDGKGTLLAPPMSEHWSAIQITTAAGICTAVDLHREGKLPSRGFVRQEQISLPVFLGNRFGRVYAQ
jgi:saccharopine dehydrogenase-like NADP-dependent oxidoreductase